MGAKFEEQYISELIGIEDKARSVIVQAIGHERRMAEFEAVVESEECSRVQLLHKLQAETAYSREQFQLVSSVTQLNAVANVRRKGRDDLSADILFDALKALRGAD